MADYPPTPPFGMAPSRAVPPYREASHHEIYDYEDQGRSVDRSLLEFHKAQTSAAFLQNATISEFSSASMASVIPPQPIYQGRGDPPYSYLQGSFGYNARFDAPRSQNSYSNTSVPSPQEIQPNISHSRDRKRPSSNSPAIQNVEEGELSEGEFEEARPEATRNAAGRASREDFYQHRRDDGAYRGVYDNSGEIEVTTNAPLTDIYGRSLDLNRHRSESYSPYEPPNEMEYEPRPAQEAFASQRQLSYQDEYEPPDEFEHVRGKARQNDYRSEYSRVVSPDSSAPNYRDQKKPSANMNESSNPDAPRLNSAIKSLHDARKEAQNAILNLLPLKIRYQDYLEEGIDEEVVRRQFESLGVPLAPTETFPIHGNSLVPDPRKLRESISMPNSGAFQPNKGGVDNRTSLREDLTLSEPLPPHTAKDSGSMVENNNATELRKDRIARLLAEKKNKQPSPVMQSDSPIQSASPEASNLTKAPSSTQAAAKADKERLLRQKMEALQKSREQRAQKAAAKTTTSAPTVSTSINESKSAQKPVDRPTPTEKPSYELPPARSASPAPTVNKQTMPSIPGLFLAAGPNAPQSPASANVIPSSVQISTQRKRPVASDFDRPSSTASSSKRPFGQNRNDQPLVIDVSDDDSEDGDFAEMEIDHPQPSSSGNYPQNGTNMAKAKTIRELPPLSDFPPRKSFPTPSSAITTPPAPSLKTSASKPEDLVRKEMEIQEMKRKIAEAEKRKRAKQNMSGSQTPRSNDSTSSPAKNNGPAITEKIEASVQIGRLIDDTSRQVDHDKQKLAEAHAEEQAKADELKRSEAEQRQLRRTEIASNLPAIDAEVEKARKKLADLHAEMAIIEAAVQKGLDAKKRLAEEMERLNQEADEQLQAQKEKLQELKLEEAAEVKVSEPVGECHPISKANTPAPVETVVSDGQSTLELNPAPTSQHGSTIFDSEIQAAISSPDSGYLPCRSAEPTHESSDKSSPDPPPGHGQNAPSNNISPDQALEVALQEATARAEAQPDGGPSIDVIMVDANTPDPEILAPKLVKSPGGSTLQNNGPAESSDDLMDVADGDSDQYEPPEATPPPKNDIPSSNSPPFSPAPPEAISETSQTNKQSDDISIDPAEPTLPKDVVHPKSPTLPPAQANQNGSSIANRKTIFTPYESPLKNFRAFRFHPAFEQEVPGGFKSITYSNNIQEDKEFCRYELAGGVCNDVSCEFQHFKDIGLADDAILVELGNSAGYSEEDKPRFVAGLRTVLQGLRAKKTKDFHVIASEIAAYRARFLGDKTKILLLDGTSS